MKMKTWVIIARSLLGFIYLVFGLDYFLHFIPYQPLHTGKPGALVAGLKGEKEKNRRKKKGETKENDRENGTI